MNDVNDGRALTVRRMPIEVTCTRRPIVKSAAVINGETIVDVAIQPGMTARDVLRAAGMPTDSWLSKSGSNLAFGENEPIWGLIRDGEKLEVSSKADVG